MAIAERELIASGCSRLEIISNNRFADAHRFYEHMGYADTGVRLQKNVSATNS